MGFSTRPTKVATPWSRIRTNKNHLNEDHDGSSSLIDMISTAAAAITTSRKIGTSSNSTSSSRSALFSDDPFNVRVSQISPEERMNSLHDLYGIVADENKIEETPELLKTKTNEMNSTLDSIANWGKPESLAFRKAVVKSPEYVDSLKIRFLRADLYDGKAAAERMIRFFDEKLKYFGEKKLVEEIYFEDLQKDEAELLNRGLVQLLPQRDRAGRALLFMESSLNNDYPKHETAMRVLFYFVMTALQDEETQKSGTVAIAYTLIQKSLVPGRPILYWKLWSAMPVRQAGFHFCQNSPNPLQWTSFVAKAMGYRQIGRLQVHNGPKMECFYNLMTFGIPREAIPIKDDDTVDLSEHHRMLEVLKYLEKKRQNQITKPFGEPQGECMLSVSPPPPSSSYAASSSSVCSVDIDDDDGDSKVSTTTTTTTRPCDDCDDYNNNKNDVILVPGPMDILLGRGRQQQKRPGMIKLNYLLEECWEDYENGSKFDKTAIALTILKRMKESNCRFLNFIPEDGGYVECDDETARTRIAHSFRSLRRKKRRVNMNTTAHKTTEADTSTTTRRRLHQHYDEDEDYNMHEIKNCTGIKRCLAGT